MKEFDYVIIGGGCAGLSLAYELEIHKKLEDKTLAIIEPRLEYKKDKTWSFWKIAPHNFDDCVKKNWENFSINIPNNTKYLECKNYPYQSIDSGLFYNKINQTLFSIFDLIKLTFIKPDEHLRKDEHNIINEQINLNERI